jgi:FkbM family methyltransferase
VPLPLWRLTTWRRKLFERFGSSRFSRPACFEIENKLMRYFGKPGFFVEAGAVDGFFESNTYYLERFRGWSGILIEPSPTMFARIAVNRPQAQAFNCALVSFDYDRPTIPFTDAHALSGIFGEAPGEEIEARLASVHASGQARLLAVSARTLQSILVEAGVQKVDLLSLDVEGYESLVLKGLDFDVFRPRYLLVECLDEKHKNEIEMQLSSWYDSLERFSYRDFFYRARSV